MLELGAQSQALHRRLGLLVVRSSIDMLITHGKHARLVARGARKNNTAIDIVHCATLSAVCKQLKGYLRPGDVVLVKGSRAMHMDKVVSFIKVMRTKGML